jgi:hypothetical protein
MDPVKPGLLRRNSNKLTDTTLIGAGRPAPRKSIFHPGSKNRKYAIERYQINYLFPISKFPFMKYKAPIALIDNYYQILMDFILTLNKTGSKIYTEM